MPQQDKQPLTLADLLPRLRDPKPDGKGGFWSFCPCHDDGAKRGRRSLHVQEKSGKLLFHCFAGCNYRDIAAALGLARERRREREPEAVYRYLDEQGEVLFEVVRFPGKNFRQRRPDGNGGWVWGLKGVRRVLYHLPEVLAAVREGRTVFVAEGEKDADNLTALGLTATTAPGGAGKWRPEYGEALRGARVVILPDNDEPGRRHAEAVAKALTGVAAEVKVVELPGLPEKGDVSDWLGAGGTKEELLALVEAAEPWQPPAEIAQSRVDAALPRIDAGNKNLPQASAQAIAALEAVNKADPHLFLHGGPARLERDDHGHLVVVPLTPDRMRWELARAAYWYTVSEEGEKPAKPPMDVVKDVLVSPLPFPPLVTITHVPTFAPDGTLQLELGYHAASKTYYAPPDGLVIPPVPNAPTQEHIERAKRLILTELLGDFPFAAEADRAHAVALALLPFCRAMVDGPTPLHMIEASSQGAGKGLLADVCLGISTGGQVGIIPPPKEDEELRKSITARLLEGRVAVLLDNIYSLVSGVLAAALTANVWDDRVLGRNETVRIPIRWVWVATGNNATVSTDIARRTIRIRLTPREERPWLKNDFRHPELRTWAKEHRSELIWACLILVQAWIAAGRPPASVKPLGSFESWSRVMGGILEYAGIPGFLGNVLEFYEVADQEGAAWREFVEAWWDKFGDQAVKVGDLFPLATEIDGLDLGKGASERAQKIAFGKKLARQKDRVFGRLRVEYLGISHQAALWRLAPAKRDGNIWGECPEKHSPPGNSWETTVSGHEAPLEGNVGECFTPSLTRELDPRGQQSETEKKYTWGQNIPPYSPHSPGPPGECPACHSRSWWRSKAGYWICQQCHPAPDPSLVVEVVNEWS